MKIYCFYLNQWVDSDSDYMLIFENECHSLFQHPTVDGCCPVSDCVYLQPPFKPP